MPKRKKLPTIPDYAGSGRDPENHLIQKSNPLLSLSQTDMTLPELKILDIYLSRIDSHNEEKRTVQLEKGEIEDCLGLSRILKPDLEKRLRNLAQMVKIEDETNPDRFILVSLFEKIGAWKDEDGLWQISLTCTNEAKKYIFNIDNIGYLRYRLANVINLTSRYSYVLYLYLEHNRYRKSWEVELNVLKAMLRCTADSYAQFKRFNDLVLKKCHNELIEKTTLRFTYSPVKRGRTVIGVCFTVETLPQLSPQLDQLSIEDTMPRPDDQIEFLRSACTPAGAAAPEFSRVEIEQLFEVLVMVDDNILPCPKDNPFDMEFRRYHYLRQKYTTMNSAHAKRPIKRRFAYLLKMVKKDAGAVVAQGV